MAHATPAREGSAATRTAAVHHEGGSRRPPQPGFFGGWLGKTHDPLIILRDPNAPDFALPELTLGLDIDPHGSTRGSNSKVSSGRAEGTSSPDDLDGILGEGLRPAHCSSDARGEVRIDREPEKLRDSYGRNIYGQSVLLSRRLIEAGSRVACVSWAPGRERHLGHARQQLQVTEEHTPAATRFRRLDVCSTTSTPRECWSARWWWSWGTSAERRRSTPTGPGATTGTSATRW